MIVSNYDQAVKNRLVNAGKYLKRSRLTFNLAIAFVLFGLVLTVIGVIIFIFSEILGEIIIVSGISSYLISVLFFIANRLINHKLTRTAIQLNSAAKTALTRFYLNSAENNIEVESEQQDQEYLEESYEKLDINEIRNLLIRFNPESNKRLSLEEMKILSDILKQMQGLSSAEKILLLPYLQAYLEKPYLGGKPAKLSAKSSEQKFNILIKTCLDVLEEPLKVNRHFR